jgi:hypothetical protein
MDWFRGMSGSNPLAQYLNFPWQRRTSSAAVAAPIPNAYFEAYDTPGASMIAGRLAGMREPGMAPREQLGMSPEDEAAMVADLRRRGLIGPDNAPVREPSMQPLGLPPQGRTQRRPARPGQAAGGPSADDLSMMVLDMLRGRGGDVSRAPAVASLMGYQQDGSR